MPTTDNRIVQMTFKNEQFERGVKESLQSLEELKKALDLDKSAESLSNLEKIASSFDISGIAKGIDDIANRFTLIGNLGQEAFRRISSFALDEVHKVTSAITSMPQIGMSKYEQKNKSVQMIQSAMPEKSIEEIEAVLAELNEYTDLTSYDFSTMANSIGKFVSAGVDLEVAEKVMEGIANETASAGGEISAANIAMYNFSQALAAGSVKLMDWRSIQNQNLDTKEFKEEIIKTAIEMGTLGKVTDDVGYIVKGSGKNIQKVQVDYKSFAETLSAGWFTSDVMIKVFEKYSNRLEGVGKKGFEAAKIAITLTQSLDAVKDAISTGWMTSFGYLFGNLEEAGDLFTRISDALIDFTSQISEARNELLRGWHTGGEDGISGYQKVIEGLSNSWAALMGIVEAAKGAFTSVFGVLDSSGLIEASKAFADFTANVREFFGVTTEVKTDVRYVEEIWDGIEQWTHPLKKGVRDSKQEIVNLQQNLLKLKDASIQLKKNGVDGIFGPETEQALKEFQKKVGLAQTGIYDQQTRDALARTLYPNGAIRKVADESEVTMTKLGKGAETLKGIFQGVAAVGKVGLGVLEFGLKLFGELYRVVLPVGKGLLEMASGLGRLISLLVDLVTKTEVGSKILEGFRSVLTPVATALKKIGGFLTLVGNGISDIVVAIRHGARNFEELKEKLMLNPKVNANGLILYDVLVKIGKAAQTVAPIFETLWGTLTSIFRTVREWLSAKINVALSTLGTLFANLWDTLTKGNYLEKILSGIGTALQIIVGVIGGVGYGIYSLAKALIEGASAMFEFVKNSQFVQNILRSIANWTKPIRDFFSAVWSSLSSISDKIGNFKSFSEVWQAFMESLKNNPLGKKFAPAFQKVTDAIVVLRNQVKAVVDSIKTAFRSLRIFNDPAKALAMLKLNPEQNKGAIRLLELLIKIGGAFRKIKAFTSDTIGRILPGIRNIGNAIGNAVKSFFGGDGKSAGEKLGEGFESIKQRLKTTFESLSAWVEKIVKNNPFINKLIDFGKTVGEAIKNFFTIDTSGIKDIPQKLMERLKAFDPVIQWIKEKFGAIKDFITDPNKLLSHVVGALKGIGTFIVGIFKNFNLSTIWSAAKSALGTYIMLTFANSLKSLSKSIGIVTGAIDKDEKEGLGDKLRHIAVTIAIVTAALAALAFIPADKAMEGIIAMAFALGAVVGAIVALNKWAPKTEGLGKGILSMTLSVVAMIAAIAAAALLVKHGGNLIKPLGLIAGILVALGAVAWALSKFGKKYSGATAGTAKTVLAMCAGVFLVVEAVRNMTNLLKDNAGHEGRVIQSLIVIGAMITALGGISALLAKFGSAGSGESTTGIASTIIAICTSLGSVVNAIGNVAKLIKKYPNDFGWAFAVVEGLLITIGGISVLLAKFGSEMDWKVSLFSAAPIVAMGFYLDKVVAVMTEGIQKISGVDPKIIEQFLIGVGEAILAMVGTVAIFSQIGIKGLLEAAAGIVVLMSAIGLGVDIMATFAADAIEKLATAMWIVGSSYGNFSDLIANINSTKIEAVMGTLTNTILPAIAQMVQYSSTIQSGKEAASDIRMFGIRLGLFQRAIRDITVDTGTAIKKLPEDIKATVDGINAIEGIDAAKDVLANLGGALKLYYGDLAQMNGETPTDENGNFDINKANEAFANLADLTLDDETIKKIQSYATDGDNDLNSFAIGIENLGTALKQYGSDIGTLDAGQVETANKVIDKAIDIDEHLNPVKDVNFNVLQGKKQSITNFGDDIAALGGALESYSDSVSKLNPVKIVMANVVMDAVSSLANKLPTTGGLWQMLTGEQSLSTFAANMSNLGDGLAQYANKVSGANFANVSSSVGPITALATAQSTIQRNGGLASVLAGSAELEQLGTGLVGLGESLVQFATAEKGIKTLKEADFTKIGQAIEPIKKLAEAQSILQNEGGWAEFLTGSSNLGNLGVGLENFADHLLKFNSSIQSFDFDDAKFISAMDLLQRVVSLQDLVQNGDDEYDFANAGRNLALLFAYVATAIRDDTEIADALDAALQNISTTIQVNSIDPAYTWGTDLVQNFANGMTDHVDLVAQAASTVAHTIWEYLHFSTPEKGSLKDADTYGGDIDETIADGIIDNQNVIEQAVSRVASGISDQYGEIGEKAFTDFIDGFSQSGSDSMVGKAKDGVVSIIKNWLSGSDADQPVITPVLDLSNVEDGIDQIPGLLNGQSVSVGTDLAKNVMSGNGVTIVQGGAAEDHSPEIIASIQEMGDRITDLANDMARQMSNLKVVMNTNALVGQIAPTMDRVLGTYSNRR